MTPIETLTCRDLTAEVAAFDRVHPGTPRTDMPRYQAIVALMQAKLPGAGTREIAAALDDTLIDCASAPDATVLDQLARHRIVGDAGRA